MDESQTFSDQRGRLPHKESARLADIILKKEKKKSPVNIILTDDRYLRDLNYRFRGKDRPTDVLAFPLDADEGLLGEIYISIETARRQAAEYRVTLREEVLRLVVHGTLHLCGYDHHENGETNVIRKREEKYLNEYLKNG